MKLNWMEKLMLFFSLFGAKTARLPGPTTIEPGDLPSMNFSCSQKRDSMGISIEINTEAVNIPWISQQTRGIAIQKITERNGQYCADEAKPISSGVTVSIDRANRVTLHGAAPEIQARLIQGVGKFALVTGNIVNGVLGKESELIIESGGDGKWKIR